MSYQTVNISFLSDAHYFDEPVTLLGVTYLFTMRYNDRSGGWTCDIADASGNPIVSGFALRTNRNLLAPYYNNAAVPRGALGVIDSTGKGEDPTRYSFNSTHKLVFVYAV